VKKRVAVVLLSAGLLAGVVHPARAASPPPVPTKAAVAGTPVCLGNVGLKLAVCLPWNF
jgi:hypothetical protein